IALVYSLTGSLNMAHISQQLVGKVKGAGILFISVLFLAGFGLKAAQVPFHAWLPDAHPSAPAPISAMLSGVLIKALGIYALIRIFYNVLGITPAVSGIFLVMGAISMLVGVLLAIAQWDFKRLLAYHSISQMGYVMLGIGLATPLGILGGLFHLINHAAFKSLLFFNSGAIEYATNTRQLKEMGGLKERMPITAATCSIASFSIAGIPPFNGFWSKLIIIIACIQAGKLFYGLIAVIVSILTLASFLKVQRYAIFGDLPLHLKTIKEVPGLMCISMIVLAIFCIGLGALIVPGIRAVVLDPAVGALQNGVEYAKIVLGN
ncbi:MAG: NADH/ubiquinone/plastoquinone (complex I), partial [Candidatus Omnitrophica bacterium]|nr:NADH/ubiquinone/plastoquinone (complex I) [Candidatus Omnitrophota bacterium]